MAKGRNLVPIPGELDSVAENGVGMSAAGVFDYNQNKFQERVNSDTLGRLAGQDDKIDQKLAEIDTKYEEFEDKTDQYFAEESEKLEAELEQAIEDLSEIPNNGVIVVDELPQEGVANAIYRVPGDDSYSDYAWRPDGQGGNEWKLLNTYQPGIDDEPTPDSDNFARSGGIAGMYGSYEENPEWAKVILDSENHVIAGVKSDGSVEWSKGVPQPVKDWVTSGNWISTGGNSLINKEFAEMISMEDDSEHMAVVTDASGKIIESINKDGSRYIYNLKSETISAANEIFENIETSTDNVELTKDANEKVLCFRDSNGVLHENAGIETKVISLQKEGLNVLSKDLGVMAAEDNTIYRIPRIPKYGTVNIRTERFYLPADPRIRSISDVECIQDFEDTPENALDKMTVCHYYIKNTNVRLQHYAYEKVDDLVTIDGVNYFRKTLKYKNGTYTVKDDSVVAPEGLEVGKFYALDPIRTVDGVCYYADSLGYLEVEDGFSYNRTKPIEGYSRIYEGLDIPEEGHVESHYVEVVEVTGPANIKTWTIEDWDTRTNKALGCGIGEKYEHACTADIDFGYYLYRTSDNYNVAYVGVKHQGNSTMVNRKRGLRIVFYTDYTYGSKDKIKIGEMLRSNKYNMKAYAGDSSKIRETFLYRIVHDIWQNRPITDRYDWDNSSNGYFHGITGGYLGFPIRLSTSGDFYGMYSFVFPKDEKNYALDKDNKEEDGFFIIGSGNTDNDWGIRLPYNVQTKFEDEVLDDMTESTVDAMNKWIDFINERLYEGTDGNDYRLTELTEIGGKFYVTDTITYTPKEDSVTAVRTQDIAYMGSDGNIYAYNELTDIDGTLYVTSTLVEGQPTPDSVTATETERHIYNGSDGNRYLAHSLVEIDGVLYVKATCKASGVTAKVLKFNKKNAPKRLDVLGFMDYFICIQVFLLVDSTHNNVVLYSNAEKKKTWPFFYDVNTGLITSRGGYNSDILDDGVAQSDDVSFWKNFRDLYWDEIVNRYCYLRNNILSIKYMECVYQNINDNIPAEDYTDESQKWGTINSPTYFRDTIMPFIEKRVEYLDENYFII